MASSTTVVAQVVYPDFEWELRVAAALEDLVGVHVPVDEAGEGEEAAAVLDVDVDDGAVDEACATNEHRVICPEEVGNWLE